MFQLFILNCGIYKSIYLSLLSFETITKSQPVHHISGIGNVWGRSKSAISVLDTQVAQITIQTWFIAGSSKCMTKDLSCLLTKLLSTIKDGLVRYCNTKTRCNGVNNMWILKNSTSLLSSLDELDVCTATSVQTFDFSTLYTSIPHNLLKSRSSTQFYRIKGGGGSGAAHQ